MNKIKHITIEAAKVLGILSLFLLLVSQMSAGVVQSQNVEAPPVANDALVYWGNNGGNGLAGLASQNIINLSTDSDWDTVVCGANHCLAIKAGALYAWGFNTSGCLGLGKGVTFVDTSIFIANIPTQIGSDTDWTCIAAGNTHSLAIRAGRLYSWGNNSNGQLGLGNTTNYDTPQQVGVDTDWTWCSAGNLWSAAVKAGQLLTCGSNGNFRTGLNTSSGNTTSFTVANSTATWTILSCGNIHGLGIRTDSLFSWGSNNNGRTGQGTNTGTTNVPTRVGSLVNWTEISAGNSHSLSIRNDSLYAYGLQLYGRLGNGSTANANVNTPAYVGSGYTDISCNIIGFVLQSASASFSNGFVAFSFAIRNDSLFGTGANTSRKELGINTGTNAVATFTLIDSVNFNYKKVAAHGGGGIAIRGN